jgi:O-antigen ligase
MLVMAFIAGVVILSWRFPGVAVPAVFYGFTAGAVGGAPQATTIVVVLLVGVLALRPLIRPANIVLSEIDLYFLLFVVWCCISTAWQPNGREAIDTATYFATNSLSVYLIFRLVGSAEDFQRRVMEMVVGFCIIGALLMPLVVGSGNFSFGRLFVGSSTPVGLALPVPYLFLSSLVLIFAVKRRRSLVVVAVLLPMSAALAVGAATGTRGALIAAVAGVAAFAALSGGLRSLLFTLVALVTLVVVALVVQYPATELRGGIFGRLLDFASYGSTLDLSSLARYEHYRFAWYLFEKNPIAGVGLGGYSSLSGFEYPHNLFLEVASKTGAVGLFLLGLLLFAVIKNAGAMLSAATERVYAATLVAFLFMAFVHQQVSFDLAQAKAIYLIGMLAAWKPRTIET